jgi:hypothetical protein
MNKPNTQKSKLKPGSRRHTILQLDNTTQKKWAVFCRSPSGQNAKFSVVHDDFAHAVEVARNHASEAASHGTVDFTYYVVELQHKVGIEGGKPIDLDLRG